MDGDETPKRTETVRRAVEVISALREDSEVCPAGTDRFDWSADLLDELARLVCMVAPVVEHITGRDNDILTARADDMATAIVAHRNALLRPDRSSGAA